MSRLIGSPPGYVGFGEGGVLTEAVRQRPYSVVLLDECEKADKEVLNIFYQVFDKGMLADGEGRVIDFKNTVIILTSNLATDLITNAAHARRSDPAARGLLSLVKPTLSAHFKPALLARMTVVPYLPDRAGSAPRDRPMKLGAVCQAGEGIARHRISRSSPRVRCHRRPLPRGRERRAQRRPHSARHRASAAVERDPAANGRRRGARRHAPRHRTPRATSPSPRGGLRLASALKPRFGQRSSWPPRRRPPRWRAVSPCRRRSRRPASSRRST